MPNMRKWKLNRFTLSNSAPKLTSVVIFTQREQFELTEKDKGWKESKEGLTLDLPEDVVVYKDIKVQFNTKKMLKTSRAFSFWLHTDFFPDDGELVLTKNDIDKVNKQKNQRDFTVTLIGEKIGEQIRELAAKSLPNPERLVVLALQMQDQLLSRNRNWQDYAYLDCFRAKDAVDWLMLNQSGNRSLSNIAPLDIVFSTKKEQEAWVFDMKRAISFGQKFLDEDIIVRINRPDTDDDKHSRFGNNNCFYRFVTEVEPADSKEEQLAKSKTDPVFRANKGHSDPVPSTSSGAVSPIAANLLGAYGSNKKSTPENNKESGRLKPKPSKSAEV